MPGAAGIVEGVVDDPHDDPVLVVPAMANRRIRFGQSTQGRHAHSVSGLAERRSAGGGLSPIRLQLAADRGRMPAQPTRDDRLGEALGPTLGENLTFRHGKMSLVHRKAPCPVRLR